MPYAISNPLAETVALVLYKRIPNVNAIIKHMGLKQWGNTQDQATFKNPYSSEYPLRPPARVKSISFIHCF